MRRILVIALSLAFVVTGACLADEIRGKVNSVDKETKSLQISGVTVKAGDAWIENEQDYPLVFDCLVAGDYVEVEGKFSDLSEIRASKIERKKLECGVVEGKIGSINAKKKEIIISGIKIKVPANTWLEGPNRVRIPLDLFAPGYSVECRGEWTENSELTAFKVVVD